MTRRTGNRPPDRMLAVACLALDDLLITIGADAEERRAICITFVRQLMARFKTMDTESALFELRRVGADFRAAVERGEVGQHG